MLGKNIKLYREANSFTQQDLADYLSIPREMISYFENDQRTPSAELLLKISDIFGLELDELLEESPKKARENVVLAFRSEEIGVENLKEIAQVKRIIKNYLKMERLIKEYGV